MARIGIIGTGWGARVQVPAFREAGLDVVGIAGSHRNKTRRVAEELDLIAFDEWTSLVVSKDIDLVSVVTPPSEHVKMATAALAGGKHVICEKPTALNAHEAEVLAAEARRRPELLALIDHELRFVPAMRMMRERIGELGAIRYAEVRYASPSRGDRKREWNWWSDAARGGGVWGAVGSHYVDTLRYLGMEIEAAQALLTTMIRERPFGEAMREVTSDDFAAVHLRLVQVAPASPPAGLAASRRYGRETRPRRPAGGQRDFKAPARTRRPRRCSRRRSRPSSRRSSASRGRTSRPLRR